MIIVFPLHLGWSHMVASQSNRPAVPPSYMQPNNRSTDQSTNYQYMFVRFLLPFIRDICCHVGRRSTSSASFTFCRDARTNTCIASWVSFDMVAFPASTRVSVSSPNDSMLPSCNCCSTTASWPNSISPSVQSPLFECCTCAKQASYSLWFRI